MKRLMNLTPLVKRPSLHVRDETIKRSFFVSSTFTVLKRGLDPLLPSLLSYLRTSTIFYKYVENFRILVCFSSMLTKRLKRLISFV